jgi:UDP-N-acetylmuramyl pentapeptide synthase
MGVNFFFIECFAQEKDETKKNIFKNIAFGKAFIILDIDDCNYLIINENKQFKIPDEYSNKSHINVSKLLWDDTDDFYMKRLELQKLHNNVDFQVTKKQDKIKIIDDHVLKNYDNIETAKRKKQMMTIACNLKIMPLKTELSTDWSIGCIDD